MNIHFEELAEDQRTGGIEAATRELAVHLRETGFAVCRSSETAPVGLPDCVHIHGIWSPKLAGSLLAWRKRGVPCVVSPHGMLAPWALSHKWFKKKVAWHIYQQRLLNCSAALHGTSPQELQQFKSLGIKPPAALIPWGVSLTSPRVGRRVSSRLRTALFVGRIYPVKGLPMLVDAWARVRPAGWKMKIVGPDEAGHRAEIKAMIQRLGLASEFEFAGVLQGKDLHEAYNQAHLFILPSFTENFGMVVAEALSHSLPVLTTTGTPWAMLLEKGCGWWVAPAAEPIAKALAIATALDDETLEAMGVSGRDWVSREFSWHSAATRMAQLYRWASGAGPVPECVA